LAEIPLDNNPPLPDPQPEIIHWHSAYAAITADADMADMTLTFVANKYPRKLMNYFTEVRHYRVEEVEGGIYHITGDYLPVQIIVTKKLGAGAPFCSSENWILKDLGRGLEREEVSSILKRSKTLIKMTPLDAYLYVLIQANPKEFEEAIEMSDDTMTVEDVLMRTGILPKWIDRGREEGLQRGLQRGREEIARNLLKKGWGIEEVAETTELDIERVRVLAAPSEGPK
jgi:predicted transposase/invertase (TIGR01784 family)